MKLMLFSDYNNIHTKRWITEMENRGWSISCISFTDVQDIKNNIFCIGPITFFSFLVSLIKIRKIIKQVAPDIVHCHFASSYGFIGNISSNVPTITSLWGSDILVSAKRNLLFRYFVYIALKKSKYILADSDELLEKANHIFPIQHKSSKIHWGINTSYFYPSNNIESGNQLKILSIRNHAPIYNIDKIIKAFGKVFKNTNSFLTICGSGSQSESLKKLANEEIPNKAYTFKGLLTEDELGNEIRNSHIIVSIPNSDGLSMSILESIGCGKFIICSDLPANREWLNSEGADFISPGNINELISAFEKASKVPILDLIEQGTNNYNKNKNLLSRNVQFDEVEKIYFKLIQDFTLKS